MLSPSIYASGHLPLQNLKVPEMGVYSRLFGLLIFALRQRIIIIKLLSMNYLELLVDIYRRLLSSLDGIVCVFVYVRVGVTFTSMFVGALGMFGWRNLEEKHGENSSFILKLRV